MSDPTGIDQVLHEAFAGAGELTLEGIRTDVEQIATWSGIAAVEVVRVLACLAAWDLVCPKCRICGCTDEQACEGGCSWVPDPAVLGELCSACLPGVEAQLRSPVARGTNR